MILDILKNSRLYYPLNRNFTVAFEFLQNTDLLVIQPGRYEISGEEIFALAAEGKGKSRDEAKLEAHHNYIDIQYLISGSEEIGWRPADDCREIAEPYLAEKDIIFYKDAPVQILQLKPGSFAVFFPGDAHAPMISDGIVKKVVLKIKV